MLRLAIVSVVVSLSALFGVAALNNLCYSIEKYDYSSGIYYENKGLAVLYNIEWKTVVYVNLNKIDKETLALRKCVSHVDTLCHLSIIRNWTGCAHFGIEARERLDQLAKTEGLLKEFTGQETGGKRRKRGIFNFIGELRKILFGTMDEDDAKFYNEQIKLFEQNSEDMDTLLKQQLSVVKLSLGAVSNTLADVAYNENLLKEGISKVTKYMDTLRSETNDRMNLFSAKIEVKGHIPRVSNAINALQHNLDLLIDSVMNAQKGVLQPQVISPITLMDVLIKSVSTFPKDTFPSEQRLSTLTTQTV